MPCTELLVTDAGTDAVNGVYVGEASLLDGLFEQIDGTGASTSPYQIRFQELWQPVEPTCLINNGHSSYEVTGTIKSPNESCNAREFSTTVYRTGYCSWSGQIIETGKPTYTLNLDKMGFGYRLSCFGSLMAATADKYANENFWSPDGSFLNSSPAACVALNGGGYLDAFVGTRGWGSWLLFDDFWNVLYYTDIGSTYLPPHVATWYTWSGVGDDPPPTVACLAGGTGGTWSDGTDFYPGDGDTDPQPEPSPGPDLTELGFFAPWWTTTNHLLDGSGLQKQR